MNQIAREVGVAPAAQFTTFAVDCVRRPEGAKRAVRSGDGMASKYHLLVTTADHRSKTDVGSRVAVIAREASERIVGYRVYYQR